VSGPSFGRLPNLGEAEENAEDGRLGLVDIGEKSLGCEGVFVPSFSWSGSPSSVSAVACNFEAFKEGVNRGVTDANGAESFLLVGSDGDVEVEVASSSSGVCFPGPGTPLSFTAAIRGDWDANTADGFCERAEHICVYRGIYRGMWVLLGSNGL
jgi:hypothetical protein